MQFTWWSNIAVRLVIFLSNKKKICSTRNVPMYRRRRVIKEVKQLNVHTSFWVDYNLSHAKCLQFTPLIFTSTFYVVVIMVNDELSWTWQNRLNVWKKNINFFFWRFEGNVCHFCIVMSEGRKEVNISLPNFKPDRNKKSIKTKQITRSFNGIYSVSV